MENDKLQLVRAIQSSMEESARPGFDDDDIQHLRVLIRLTVEFHNYLQRTPEGTVIASDGFDNMIYAIDSILISVDSFQTVMHSYGILVGSTSSTIDGNAISVRSLKDQFETVYKEFIAETKFENKCRLLLDLYKLQIVFAGAFYDCEP